MRANPLFIFLVSGAGLFAQPGNYFRDSRPFSAQNDIFGIRVFVENRGQFNTELTGGREVKYALENGLEKIYFTATGVVYQQVKPGRFGERERERQERD